MRNADRYSGLSTINHWITALLVLAMLLLGLHFLGALKHFLVDRRRETPADM